MIYSQIHTSCNSSKDFSISAYRNFGKDWLDVHRILFFSCLASSCVHRIEIWPIGCNYMQGGTYRSSPYSSPTYCPPLFLHHLLTEWRWWQRPKEDSRATGQEKALSLNDHIKGAQVGMPARNFDKSKKLTFTANLLWFCIYLLQQLMSPPKHTESEKVSYTSLSSTFTKLCYLLEFPLLTMACHL